MRIFGFTPEQYRVGLACLLFATSFFVIVEPAPSEFLFTVLLIACLSGGLTLHALIAPLILLLLIYNLGGFMSLQQVLTDPGASQKFVLISIYMALMGMFFAAFIAHRPRERLEAINSAWIFGATIAAILGIVGFFDIGGLGETLTLYGRATSTFKDPNVFSTYIIYPTVVATQRLLTGNTQRPLLLTFSMIALLAGQFLALSRGAWAFYILATIIMVFLTFVFSTNAILRSRIAIMAFAGGLIVTMLIAALLTIEPIRQIFEQRFSLQQSYDFGEVGRFGNQLNSIPMLLERPLGFGPYEFHFIFPEDPHNTFLNAFASYGWLGGLSYFALIIMSIWVAFRTVFRASPYRDLAIPVFAALICLFLQGVQIDTDHWRHFYWLLGFMWGLFLAAELTRQNQDVSP
jgi:hypothetical protein